MKMLEVYDEKLEVYYDDLREAINMLNAGTAGSAGEASPSTLRYKARPLDGIWATAPYLHNGSVPNLYELLLPVERRTKEFYVGSTEFDPKHVGFATKESPGTTMFDTSDPGNSNSGHDTYGDFNDDERWQLVEYMKSL
jgi:hypothetical protein